MKAQCTSIVLAYFLPLIDCNLARVKRVVHGKTLLSRVLYRDTSQRRVTSRLMRRKLSGDAARQKPLYASTTSTFFDISDVFSGVGPCCLVIYPICLFSRNYFLCFAYKFEDTTGCFGERELRDNTASHLLCSVAKSRFARRSMGDLGSGFWIGTGFRN